MNISIQQVKEENIALDDTENEFMSVIDDNKVRTKIYKVRRIEKSEDNPLSLQLNEGIMDLNDTENLYESYDKMNSSEVLHEKVIYDGQGLIMEEYNRKVSQIMRKIDSDWACGNCAYTSNQKHHVSEHIGTHIEGYAFKCSICEHTTKTKGNYRQHKNKCKRLRLNNKLISL